MACVGITALGGGLVARKKTKRVYQAGAERISVVTIKGSTAYRDWLNDMADESRIACSVIVRDALAAWAKANGYPRPPEI